jgi:hypothetical protein
MQGVFLNTKKFFHLPTQGSQDLVSNRIFSTIYTRNHLKNIGNCGTKIAPTTRAKQEQPTIQQKQKQAPKK